mmetsp:Transcript_159073/g.506683  ORF Transcript_159073/g.506683 Transcript_159073/m.506683 type:complete len:208 (+) Transcript_159073:274-897(+)
MSPHRPIAKRSLSRGLIASSDFDFGVPHLTFVLWLAVTFVVGSGATALALWWHFGPLLPAEAPPASAPASMNSALYGDLYCKQLLTSSEPEKNDLGAAGAAAAAASSSAPALLAMQRCQRCLPLAGNSDVSKRSFELMAPYWRMVDILPTVDLDADTVSVYCERPSTLGVSVGVYSDAGLLASSGAPSQRTCVGGEWLDVPIGPPSC